VNRGVETGRVIAGNLIVGGGAAACAAEAGECETGASEAVATTRQFWTQTTNFRGITVYQRPDLVDPTAENLGRMQRGLAPIGPDGASLQLHHLLQANDSPIAEVSQTFHAAYGRILNINPNTMGSVIDRATFAVWRADYWIQRATDILGGQ
jgi:hypothetical protein